ncbi:TIGR03986 family CRISPR-associated RAMP protein [Candidatus Parabeggiatoa sp. HSG14]|uniref:TIGR03986 family type III CRISPR-associated RAMP protein n=1 Tax=Candidatus Parabeggiatoa sp. HSG14 TaxID=3055593 RepID=UPI0025A8A72C|nr:TIGR03986 family CRISPR-associated RAMP protein [Thiotrichales bacterium HSG14]
MANSFTEITAPYNFVPLSGWVFQPDWVHQVSHDIPFEKGLSGSLNIKITAKTPILVGGKQQEANKDSPGEVRFFKVNSQEAIPGSSLKGMIRNVLEIASFGKMQFVDNRRLSIRDISGREVIGDNYDIGKPKAGFLQLKDDSSIEIIPCDFIHISHRDMEGYLNKHSPPYIFTKRETPTVRQKYERWNNLDNQKPPDDDTLPQIAFNVNSSVTPKMATDLGHKSGRHIGTLVLTGQISDKSQNNNGKYRDFVFFDRREAHNALPVSPEIFKDFLYIHGDEEKKSTGSWQNYWRDQLFKSKHREIPVFYHVDINNEVRSIGLAYMYRLAYHHSIGETIDYTNKNHRNPEGYDLADLLFGKINSNEEHSPENLKSRVSFGLATLVGTAQPAEAHYSKPTVLNGPKPTYFPNYVRQQASESTKELDKSARKSYRTYMQKDSEIRGWKRYPVRRWQEVHIQAVKQEFRGKKQQRKNTQVRLFPLKEGTTFKSTIRFHNLLPQELGALIWALRWGGDERLSHGLGMAKSFGFGQVKLEIVDNDIRNNQNPKKTFDERHYISLFKNLMEENYAANKQQNMLGKWGDSEQIRLLKAMAYPEHALAKKDTLKHLQLEDNQRKNQFVIAKQNGWVLPEYGRYSNRDADLFPRKQRRQRPKLKPKTSAEAINNANQWIETTLNDLKNKGQLPSNVDAICTKALAEKWKTIEDAALKKEVLEEISQRWTNLIPDEEVDWWKIPPSKGMKRIKKIYDQG